MELLSKMLRIQNPTPEERSALTAMLKCYATSTWNTRCGIYTRFNKWATGAPLTPLKAVSFLVQVPVSIQAKLSYVKALKALCLVQGQDPTPLSLYSKSLVAQGALVPIHQAAPLTHAMTERLLSFVKDKGTRIAIKTARKTCSRWSEAAGITRDMCPTISEQRVVIAWGQRHKTGRLKPVSRHMYTVIEGSWTRDIASHLRTLKDGQPLSRWSTQKLTRVMKKLFGHDYSSHSIKSGGISYLLTLVTQGIITLEQVARLAKHENVESTLGYGREPEVVALALGTQRVTSLL